VSVGRTFVLEDTAIKLLAEESHLLERVRGGDQSALSDLYDRYSRLVYSISLRILQNSADAEDVLQEIFLGIWRRPDLFDPSRGSLTAWLSTVTRNKSIGILRSRRRIQPLGDLNPQSPLNLVTLTETKMTIDKAKTLILKMPPHQRRMLEMAFFEGKTHEEIALETDCPLGTVKTRIRMGLKSMRPKLSIDSACK
jgi:RNA polymerase sigma-70 factor, ECF subfamily